MDSVKTIRAVERAFDVLAALQRMPDGATLTELRALTGLSGPTLLRLLKTLIGVKAVRRSMTDERYRNAIQLNILAGATTPMDRFADIAAPWLDRLCQQAEWPSDLAIHRGDDDCMMVLESSLRQSRFFVRRSFGRVRVNLLGSAAGTAFLSGLSVRRRDALVRACRSGRDVHNLGVIAANDLEPRVEAARALGYASRHRLYRGGSYNAVARDDALHAIAVPIVAGQLVLGALNINWNRAAMTEAQMVRRHLRHLQATAEGIGMDAARLGLLDDLKRCAVTEAVAN